MNKFLILLIIILVIITGVLGYLLNERNVEYNYIFSILKNKHTKSDLIINGKYIYDYNFIKDNNQIYLPIKLLIEKIDENIELSNSGARIFIQLKNMNIKFENSELNEFVFDSLKSINVPLRVIEGDKYISLKMIEKLYAVDYSYYIENNRLAINIDKEYNNYINNSEKNVYFLEEELLIKFDKLNKTEKFILLKKMEINNKIYLKIITPNGQIGYISNVDVKISKEQTHKENILKVKKAKEKLDTVNLVWDSISSFNDKKNFEVSKHKGLNVISPTWFNLNVDGIVINSASMIYSEKAHNNGYQVWGLYKNNFDPKWTDDLLTSEEYMDKSIAQILFYSLLYDLDGINIDFENIYLKNKADLVKYITKMRKYTDIENLVLSIDAVVPGGSDRYSKVIDRENIIKYVDYLVLMAYDEHWGTSPESGSVASLPWVRKGIEGTLEFVNNEKMILGVPLYTRVWTEGKNGKISSKAYSLKNIGSFLKKIDYKIEYDTDAKQNFIESKYNGLKVEIWLEDKESLKKRIELINEYNIAGIAGWRKGYEEEYYWQLINMYLE